MGVASVLFSGGSAGCRGPAGAEREAEAAGSEGGPLVMLLLGLGCRVDGCVVSTKSLPNRVRF